MGGNRDDILGGGDWNGTPIPAGGERSFSKSADQFASTAGPWRIGVSYLSQQNEWFGIPAVTGGTLQKVKVDVHSAQPAPASKDWLSMGGVLASPGVMLKKSAG